MTYSTFPRGKVNALEAPMFFGSPVSIARYDQQKYPFIERLTEKQLSFFWRPEEIDLSQDRKDFVALAAHEQNIFLRNLQYQILLDSVQGRSPNVAFLPHASLPEMETWLESWGFYETIHSRSYTHILRNLFTDPAPIFDEIPAIPEIVDRAAAVTHYYDYLIAEPSPEVLYLALASANILEGIRFYVSFACSFAFAERKLMEGNAKIIRLIARDEALHLSATQYMLNAMATGKEGDTWQNIANAREPQLADMFENAAQQEMAWADYLFQDGSMLGLNSEILHRYIRHIINTRAAALGLKPIFDETPNPLPWMNNWLVSDNVQVAPQETEISSYLVGQIDAAISSDDFGEFNL